MRQHVTETMVERRHVPPPKIRWPKWSHGRKGLSGAPIHTCAATPAITPSLQSPRPQVCRSHAYACIMDSTSSRTGATYVARSRARPQQSKGRCPILPVPLADSAYEPTPVNARCMRHLHGARRSAVKVGILPSCDSSALHPTELSGLASWVALPVDRSSARTARAGRRTRA